MSWWFPIDIAWARCWVGVRPNNRLYCALEPSRQLSLFDLPALYIFQILSRELYFLLSK
jgi:hypothetical protein